MAKRIVILFVLFLGWSSLYAQQLPMYSQYMVNDFVLNPAIAGTKPYYEAKSDNRYQWEGITDAPRTYIISLNGPFAIKNVGIGGYMINDVVGPTRRTGFLMTYAYHLKLTSSMKLSFGLSGGILQFAIDGSQITLENPSDNVLSTGYQSVLVPDFGCGAYLYSDNYFFGVSTPQIYQSKLKFFDNSTNQSKIVTHYYAIGGYKYAINSEFTIEPTVMVKFVSPAPVQVDGSVRAFYQNKFWLGAGYRTQDAAYAMIGYTYKDALSFGYSYDYTLTDIKKYSTGTHEVVLSFIFGKKAASTDNTSSSDQNN